MISAQTRSAFVSLKRKPLRTHRVAARGQAFCGSCFTNVSVRTLSFSTFAPYIGRAGSPAMEINRRRNKPFGPGGGTRRLHPSPHPCTYFVLAGRASAGAKQDRRGRKGRAFSRYCSAVIGLLQ